MLLTHRQLAVLLLVLTVLLLLVAVLSMHLTPLVQHALTIISRHGFPVSIIIRHGTLVK